MMMRTFFFWLMACLPLWARLGETEQQCVARYGKGFFLNVENDRKDETFKVGEFTIEVTFMDGRAVFESYSRDGVITADEVHAILDKESSLSMEWKGPTGTDGMMFWSRSDRATAVFCDGVLSLVSPQYKESPAVTAPPKSAAQTTSGL